MFGELDALHKNSHLGHDLNTQETLGTDHFCRHEPGQTENDTWTFLAL